MHRRGAFNAAKLPNCSKVSDWDSARNLPFMAKTSEFCFVCVHVKHLFFLTLRFTCDMLFSTAIGNIHCGDPTHAQPESPKPEGALSSTSARARMGIWIRDKRALSTMTTWLHTLHNDSAKCLPTHTSTKEPGC